ncbi:MAG: hypothetical protein HY527_08975 [Betaproteobacteria bacterium]|nr:hypothetical protein [Betaproteobacteria bacterium]
MKRAALVAAALLTATPGVAAAHVDHRSYEPPDTQLTRDYALLHVLLTDPSDRFELARHVYDGKVRVRLKPGGFRRTWLRRHSEPGLVFKARYQRVRWSGSLRGEAVRIDGKRGTAIAREIEASFVALDAAGVERGLRAMFVVLLEELTGAFGRHLEKPATAERLHGYVVRYYAAALEAHLTINHPHAARAAGAALRAMETTLTRPAVFHEQRHRFLSAIRYALDSNVNTGSVKK